jgi:predicted pyridoxine 5'-phosphate oxidase superfamily flavin-nucleotide-binding protein
MKPEIQNIIATAEHFALATIGEQGLNVVPVRFVFVIEQELYVANIFMNKTIENIRADGTVALAAWSGSSGVQVKGQVVEITDGDIFQAVAERVTAENADAQLQSVLHITAAQAFTVNPGEGGASLS